MPIEKVKANPWQPRRDTGDVTKLAESIEREGLLQLPLGRLCCSVNGNGAEPCHGDGEAEVVLAFGHRRHRAVESLGRQTIDVLVDDLGDTQMVQYALAENRERVAVQEIEELESAARALKDVEGLKQQEVAAWMGWSRTTLTKRLKVLLLPDEMLDMVRNDEISVRGGLALLALRGRDGHFHEDVALKALNSIHSDKTVDKIEEALARVRPSSWIEVTEKIENVTHRMRRSWWNDSQTGFYCCDEEVAEKLRQEYEAKIAADKEKRVEVLEPLVSLDEAVIRSLLALMKPSWSAADDELYELMGLEKNPNYGNFSGLYSEWASKATGDDLMSFARWRLGARND